MATDSPLAQQVPVLVNGSGYADVLEWTNANPEWDKALCTYGSILFRGFPGADSAVFDAAIDALMQPSLEFAEETSPRSAAGARIFTSTDYPPAFPIQFHHEFSYRQVYPEMLAFYCIRPAAKGGATPLADSRKVLERLPDSIVARFEAEGITYTRNFTGLGVSWTDSFGTTDKAEISAYCERHAIDHSWSGEDLHTRQSAPAVITHPLTSERTWFNSVVNLNVLGVEPPAVREALRGLPADSIPTNTTYGSGHQVESDVIEQIRQAYADEAIRFDWQAGDLLVIDNILTAHSRDPFEGDRRILVGMGNRKP